MKSNIVLTGFMATGKTTVGQSLSLLLHKKFIDADVEIERATRLSIPQIFSLYGEARFRAEEALILKKLAQFRDVVIATGGGAVLHVSEMEELGRHGYIICLTAAPETILARIAAKSQRPLLPENSPIEYVMNLLAQREAYYRRADLIIDTTDLNIDEISQEILRFVEEKVR
ncbi:MAG: shikimate kinase [Syntrophomonadaceae bacterium]|nr:shikimate kinase [Syntrophomonadaceae bacterium]